MSRGYVSWLGATERDVFGSYGKMVALLLDEILIQVPRADMIATIMERHYERVGVSTRDADELLKIIVPVQTALPSYQFLQRPWEHENRNLVEIAKRVTIEATLHEYPGADKTHPGGFAHEVGWAGAGLIEAVATWGALQVTGECVFLADSREGRVVAEVFHMAHPPAEVPTFTEVLQSAIPDFGSLSWQRVLELRRHPFLEEFRRKIRELSSSISDHTDRRDVGDALRELELHDLRQLARLVSPSPQTATIKAIASNIPLPIPINPVSIGLGIKDVKDAWERKRRFGWLYFLMDVTKR